MSTRQDTLQTTFAGGEVDPMVHGRQDTRSYLAANASCLNVMPVNQGGLRRRPGTYFVGYVEANTRIFGVTFADDQRFIIGVHGAGVRIWSTTGTLITSFSTVTHLFNGATFPLILDNQMLLEIQFTVAGDSLFLTHPLIRPILIRRDLAGTWEMVVRELWSEAGLPYQPWHKFADAEVTLTPSQLTNGATLTASADHFKAGHLNTPLRYRGVDATITSVTDARNVVVSTTELFPNDETGVQEWAATTPFALDDIIRTPAGQIYICTVAGTSGASPPTGTGSGIVSGTTTWTHRPLKPSTSWSEPAWSDLRGFPRTCVYHEQRLWFAGTSELPNGLWASRIGDYFNFDVGTGLDDEAIGIILVTDRVPHIRFLHSARYLEVFTSIGEWYVPSSEAVPITPGNVAVKRQTPYGCGVYAAPAHLDGASLFCDRTGRAVREFKLDNASSAVAYSAESVSLLAPHLIRVPVTLEVQYGTPERAEQLAWVVNQDGTMAVFHSIRSENVAGWYRWTTPMGLWRDVAAAGDDVFFVVERDGVWTLELLAASQDELCLDCAETVNRTGVGSYTGLAHLAGETVHVTTPGWYLGLYQVSGTGGLQLDDGLDFDYVSAGYDYGIRIKTLPVIGETRAGPVGAAIKRIVSAIIRIEDTASLSVGPYPLITRHVTDDFSDPPNPASGPFRLWQGGYDRLGQVEITQEAPLPCSILSLQLKVAF